MRSKAHPRPKNGDFRRGFTFTELLVVIALICIFVGVVWLPVVVARADRHAQLSTLHIARRYQIASPVLRPVREGDHLRAALQRGQRPRRRVPVRPGRL